MDLVPAFGESGQQIAAAAVGLVAAARFLGAREPRTDNDPSYRRLADSSRDLAADAATQLQGRIGVHFAARADGDPFTLSRHVVSVVVLRGVFAFPFRFEFERVTPRRQAFERVCAARFGGLAVTGHEAFGFPGTDEDPLERRLGQGAGDLAGDRPPMSQVEFGRQRHAYAHGQQVRFEEFVTVRVELGREVRRSAGGR